MENADGEYTSPSRRLVSRVASCRNLYAISRYAQRSIAELLMHGMRN